MLLCVLCHWRYERGVGGRDRGEGEGGVLLVWKARISFRAWISHTHKRKQDHNVRAETLHLMLSSNSCAQLRGFQVCADSALDPSVAHIFTSKTSRLESAAMRCRPRSSYVILRLRLTLAHAGARTTAELSYAMPSTVYMAALVRALCCTRVSTR